MWTRETRQLVELACDEDLGAQGDVSARLLPEREAELCCRVTAREAGVICGLALGPLICSVFAQRLGDGLEFTPAERDGGMWTDGDAVAPGDCVALLRGRHAAVLTTERTLLNFLTRMSGVASLTRQYVAAATAVNPNVRILDTRKTIPGWRELDKYAVHAGGGKNHRFGLYDAILIKDNHIVGVPVERLAAFLENLLSQASPAAAFADPDRGPGDAEGECPDFIEVEVDNLAQFEQVCQVSAVDIVLLDNFSLTDLRTAVALRDQLDLRGKLRLEASGGVTLETVAAVAATGVDRISVGALTHAAHGLDLGLDS